MRKILSYIVVGVAAGLALWLFSMIFIGVAVVGLVGYGIYHARYYLTEKGILNPRMGVPPEEQEERPVTIIEGDFQRLEEESKN